MSWAVTAPEAATTQVYAIANSFSAPIHRPMMLFAPLRHVARFAVPAAAALSFTCSPLAAEDVPAPQAEELQADPYTDIYLALEESADQEQMLDNMISATLAEIVRNEPLLELMEAEKPGLLDGLSNTIRPILREHVAAIDIHLKPRMADIFRNTLSVDEAIQIASFYRSDLVRKLMVGTFANFTGERTIRGVLENSDDSTLKSSFEADSQSAGIKGYIGLTPEERKQVDDLAAASPAIEKFIALKPDLTAVRLEAETMPLAPELEARLVEEMQLFLADHFDQPTGEHSHQ